jgi:hypothetical protein
MTKKRLFYYCFPWILLAVVLSICSWIKFRNSHIQTIAFLDQNTHDFGTLYPGQKCNWQCSYTNRDDSPVWIKKIVTDCGCLTEAFSRVPVEKGQSEKISFIFEASTIPLSKPLVRTSIIFFENKHRNWIEQITLRANVKPGCSVNVESIVFNDENQSCEMNIQRDQAVVDIPWNRVHAVSLYSRTVIEETNRNEEQIVLKISNKNYGRNNSLHDIIAIVCSKNEDISSALVNIPVYYPCEQQDNISITPPAYSIAIKKTTPDAELKNISSVRFSLNNKQTKIERIDNVNHTFGCDIINDHEFILYLNEKPSKKIATSELRVEILKKNGEIISVDLPLSAYTILSDQ